MKTHVELPGDATRWLRGVNRRLRALASDQRAEIVDGLRAHLVEGIADGEDAADVIARLGHPADVARAAIAEARDAGDTPRLPRYLTPKRVVQIAAFVLTSAGAFLLIYLEAELNSVGVANVTVSDEGNGIVVDSPQPVGVGHLLGRIALAGLFVAAAAWPLAIRGRAWPVVSIASAVVLTPIAFLVWGPADAFLAPAAAASIVAVFLPPRLRNDGGSGESSPRPPSPSAVA